MPRAQPRNTGTRTARPTKKTSCSARGAASVFVQVSLRRSLPRARAKINPASEQARKGRRAVNSGLSVEQVEFTTEARRTLRGHRGFQFKISNLKSQI